MFIERMFREEYEKLVHEFAIKFE